MKHLRIEIAVAAHRVRFTAVGPLDAANARRLTDAARRALGRQRAAVHEVGTELVTNVDRSGVPARLATLLDADRRHG